MGAKTALLAFTDGDLRPALRGGPRPALRGGVRSDSAQVIDLVRELHLPSPCWGSGSPSIGVRRCSGQKSLPAGSAVGCACKAGRRRKCS